MPMSARANIHNWNKFKKKSIEAIEKQEAFESLETKANNQSLVANFASRSLWNQEDKSEDEFAQRDLKKYPLTESKT